MITALINSKKKAVFAYTERIEFRKSILFLINTIDDIKAFWSQKQEFFYGQLPDEHVKVVLEYLEGEERSRFLSALQRYDSRRLSHCAAPYPGVVSVNEVAGNYRIAYPEWYILITDLRKILVGLIN